MKNNNKMRSNGFTLIELLAIIVILAIIAVITVPIILNVIENSKKGTALDSAYGYKDAVYKAFATYLTTNPTQKLPTGIYVIDSTGKLVGSDGNYDVNVSGNEPGESSWVELEKGQVVAYSLKFDDYVVTMYRNSEVTVVKNGEIANVPIDTAFFDSLDIEPEDDGAKYFTDAIEIYFDPTLGTSGALCDSDDEGCLHWFLYSVKGDYANMLLDHNISDGNWLSEYWISEDAYSNGLTPIMDGNNVTGYQIDAESVRPGITYPGVSSIPEWGRMEGESKNARGPVIIFNTITSLTSSWKTGRPMVPNSSSTREYIIPSSENDNLYQIDYTGFHARLLTRAETEYLGCVYNSGGCPDWMMTETTKYGSDVKGYFTSTPDSNSGAVGVYYYENSEITGIYVNASDYGLRPVITVPISDIAEQLN